MILAVSHPNDEHAPLVLDALQRLGAPVTLLDLADFPRRGRFALEYGPGSPVRELRVEGRPPIVAAEVTAVWWRRPEPMVASPDLAASYAAFAVRQASEAMMGLLASLQPGVRFVNDPWLNEAAGHKPNQLARAARHGLRLPATVVTSDPATARAFLAAPRAHGAVFKHLRATEASWRTRRVTARDLDQLEAVRHAPVIFQEYVPGVDVRVTAVGDQLLAADFDARATRTPEDFRPATAECAVAPVELPAEVAAGLRSLLRELGLLYAACDFRRAEDGTWYFLEVNPSGQWGFVEERAGLPITEALARLLAGAS